MTPSDRERLAFAFREWVHESSMSQCNMGADECPDWPLAYELADIALGIVSTIGEGGRDEQMNSEQSDSQDRAVGEQSQPRKPDGLPHYEPESERRGATCPWCWSSRPNSCESMMEAAFCSRVVPDSGDGSAPVHREEGKG